MVRVEDLALRDIHRPLDRFGDQGKVESLVASIAAMGLQEPIEAMEVQGQYYGFSGCHRYDEACARLGLTTIRCLIRRATPAVLRMHFA